MPALTEALGEIIEASTTEFVAQCRLLYEPPAFGSFVKVAPPRAGAEEPDPFVAGEPGAIYGLVYSARTASIDPGRRAAAYGLDEEALRQQQPQVLELLATEFSALTMGHADGTSLQAVLPPRPPRVHAAVVPCTPEEVRALADPPSFARTVLSSPACPAGEELVAAALAQAAGCMSDADEYLVRAMREVAKLLRSDYARLDAILRKLGR